MAKENIEQVPDRIEKLFEQFLAIQLYQPEANQQTIAKHLGVSKTTANEFLKGVEKGKKANEDTKPQNN